MILHSRDYVRARERVYVYVCVCVCVIMCAGIFTIPHVYVSFLALPAGLPFFLFLMLMCLDAALH